MPSSKIKSVIALGLVTKELRQRMYKNMIRNKTPYYKTPDNQSVQQRKTIECILDMLYSIKCWKYSRIL